MNDPDSSLSLEQTIAMITRMMADMEARAFQQEGFSDLSMRQVLYMETIERLGHPSFSELAKALNVTRPSVTTLVGKLIHAGYLQKVQDNEDRRSFHILLTLKGQQFTQLHQDLHKMVVQTLTDRLNSTEIEHLSALLRKALGA
jgi:DNA-binding MarR family transcriptional regulator